jgi:hydrogenase maturation protein HypF
VRLPLSVPPLLAVGGELKNTFCLAQGEHAFLSPHIGDVETLETVEALERAVRHFERLYGITPERIVCDLHPGYASTRWAEREAARRGVPLIKVQHHHAHIAGLMAEHGRTGETPVLGLCFDGTGYGSDGAIWGGELLFADYRGFRRLAHLRYTPLPGGDSAIRHPARAALAHLWAAGVPWTDDLPPVAATTEAERRVILRQLETGFNAPLTSSAGRLFDAVAALVGLSPAVTYEAQAAMEFENLTPRPRVRPEEGEPRDRTHHPSPEWRGAGGEVYDFALLPTDPLQLDARPVLAAVAADVRAGVPAAVIAAKFHAALAQAAVRLLVRARTETGVNVAALSGGVFQNTVLLAAVSDGLRDAGFDVLIHEKTPPNDGGLALGQAILGGLKQTEE